MLAASFIYSRYPGTSIPNLVTLVIPGYIQRTIHTWYTPDLTQACNSFSTKAFTYSVLAIAVRAHLVRNLSKLSLPHPQQDPLRKQGHQLLVVELARQQHHVRGPLKESGRAAFVDRHSDGFQGSLGPNIAASIKHEVYSTWVRSATCADYTLSQVNFTIYLESTNCTISLSFRFLALYLQTIAEHDSITSAS